MVRAVPLALALAGLRALAACNGAEESTDDELPACGTTTAPAFNVCFQVPENLSDKVDRDPSNWIELATDAVPAVAVGQTLSLYWLAEGEPLGTSWRKRRDPPLRSRVVQRWRPNSPQPARRHRRRADRGAAGQRPDGG